MDFLFVVFDCTFHALFLFACCCYGLADFEISNSMGTDQVTNKKMVCPGYKGSGQLHKYFTSKLNDRQQNAHHSSGSVASVIYSPVEYWCL